MRNNTQSVGFCLIYLTFWTILLRTFQALKNISKKEILSTFRLQQYDLLWLTISWREREEEKYLRISWEVTMRVKIFTHSSIFICAPSSNAWRPFQITFSILLFLTFFLFSECSIRVMTQESIYQSKCIKDFFFDISQSHKKFRNDEADFT